MRVDTDHYTATHSAPLLSEAERRARREAAELHGRDILRAAVRYGVGMLGAAVILGVVIESSDTTPICRGRQTITIGDEPNIGTIKEEHIRVTSGYANLSSVETIIMHPTSDGERIETSALQMQPGDLVTLPQTCEGH
jgi:hypothetical protein